MPTLVLWKPATLHTPGTADTIVSINFPFSNGDLGEETLASGRLGPAHEHCVPGFLSSAPLPQHVTALLVGINRYFSNFGAGNLRPQSVYPRACLLGVFGRHDQGASLSDRPSE